MLEFCLFGALDLRDRTDRHRLRSVLGQPKRVALLAYIAASNPRGCVRRDQLLGLFWPELDAAHARSALNQSLYVLRQALGEDVLEARGTDELCVNRQRLWCDVATFRDAISNREFAAALEVYAGDLLTGFFLSDCPEFEQWVESERTQLRNQASSAAWQLAEEAEANANPLDAVHWARRACSLAPYDEIPHQRLLRLQQRIGDRAGALRDYESFARRVREELEIEPSAETRRIAEEIQMSDPAAPETPHRPVIAAAASQKPKASNRSKHGAVVAGCALVVLIGFAAVLRYTTNAAEPRYDDRAVLVSEFDNRTGDDQLEYLGRAAADWLAQELASTGMVQVIPAAEQRPVNTRARYVVEGAYYRHGDRVRVTARVIENPSGRLRRAVEVSLPGAVSELSAIDTLRRRVVGAFATLIDARLATWAEAASQPPSYQAYRDYASGLDLFLRADPRSFRQAAQLLEQAADADSTFTAPLIWAIFARMNVRDWRGADSVAKVLSARRATMPPWDQTLLDHQLAHLRGDHESAYREAQKLVALAPRSEWRYLLANSAFASNRPREAVDALQQMSARQGFMESWPGYWYVLIGARHMLGDHTRELSDLARARSLRPNDRVLALMQLRAQVAAGRWEAAHDAARALTAAPLANMPPGEPLRISLLEASVHDNEPALTAISHTILQRYAALPASQRSPYEQENAATALALTGRWQEARRRFDELLRQEPRNSYYIAWSGITAARVGDRAHAMQAMDELARLKNPYAFGRPTLLRAGLAAHLGDLPAAASLVKQALAEGEPTDLRYHSATFLAPLRAQE